MATKRAREAAAPKLEGEVTLVPVPGHWIHGVPAVEQTVSAERAAELLAYFPPAFVVKEAPAKAAETNEDTAAPASGEEN